MGSMSLVHWVVVLVIVLLVFGTKRLVSGAGDLGKAWREFRKGVQGEDEKSPGQLSNDTTDQSTSQNTHSKHDSTTR
jgi:sec-independent protein translocase protein TatA